MSYLEYAYPKSSYAPNSGTAGYNAPAASTDTGDAVRDRINNPVAPTFSLTRLDPVRTPVAELLLSRTTADWAPTIDGQVILDSNAKLWRYKLTEFDSGGTILIVYMDEKHYPAPGPPYDDSGDLTNVTKQNWKEILRDLSAHKFDTPEFWYSYQREDLHENYHWNVQWKGIITAMVPKLEADYSKLAISSVKFPTSDLAKKIFDPAVNRALKLRYDAALAAFDHIPDLPGKGSPAYDAAAVGVQKLIERIEKHVIRNGWK